MGATYRNLVAEEGQPAEAGEAKSADGGQCEEEEHDQALVGGGEGFVTGGDAGDVGEDEGEGDAGEGGEELRGHGRFSL